MVITPDDKVQELLATDPNIFKPGEDKVPHVYYIKDEPAEVTQKNPWRSATEAMNDRLRSVSKSDWEALQDEETLANLDRGASIGKTIHQLFNNSIGLTKVDIPRLTGVVFNPKIQETLGVTSFDYNDDTNETTYGGILNDLIKIADPYGKGGGW